MPAYNRPLLGEEAAPPEACAAAAPRPCALRAWLGLLALALALAALLVAGASLPDAAGDQPAGAEYLSVLSDSDLLLRKDRLVSELAAIDEELSLRSRGSVESDYAVSFGAYYSDSAVPRKVLAPLIGRPNLAAAIAVILSVAIFVFLTVGFAQNPEQQARSRTSTYESYFSSDTTQPHQFRRPSTTFLRERPDFWNDHAELCRQLKENLQLERKADLSCSGLCLNRPWKMVEGPEIVPDRVTSNAEWRRHTDFPNGHRNLDVQDRANMFRLVLEFWKFLWAKKRPYKCILLMLVEGVCVPLLAQAFGMLLSECKQTGNSTNLCYYAMIMFILNLMYQRAEYIYEIDVPGASVRYEFTYRLHKQFLNFEGPVAEKWPPGRCSAMLSYDVIQAVNLNWEAVFGLVKTTTSLIMCTLLMRYNTGSQPRVTLGCCIIFAALFIGTILITFFRIPNCLDLANKKRDWQLAWMAICTLQVRKRREGIKFNVDEAAQEVSDAAMVFRKRAFHYYFIRLVAALTPAQMAFIAESLVAVLAGLSAINHNLTTSQAAALIGVVKLLSGQLKEWVTIMLNVVEGFSSLVEICEVFNEDIDETKDNTTRLWRAMSVPVNHVCEHLDGTLRHGSSTPAMAPGTKNGSFASTHPAGDET